MDYKKIKIISNYKGIDFPSYLKIILIEIKATSDKQWRNQ